MAELTPEQQAKELVLYHTGESFAYQALIDKIAQLVRSAEERGRQAERQRCIEAVISQYGPEGD